MTSFTLEKLPSRLELLEYRFINPFADTRLLLVSVFNKFVKGESLKFFISKFTFEPLI